MQTAPGCRGAPQWAGSSRSPAPHLHTHPADVFFSLAHSRTSVKRKTCRSFREPSDTSTRKPSFTSCRVWGRWYTQPRLGVSPGPSLHPSSCGGEGGAPGRDRSVWWLREHWLWGQGRGLKSRLCHFLAVILRAISLISLSLSLSNCKMGTMIFAPQGRSHGVCRTVSTVPGM